MTTTALGLRLPRRWTARHGGRLVVRLALYAIVAAIFLVPLWSMVATAFSAADPKNGEVFLVPHGLSLAHLTTAWQLGMGRGLLNSLIVVTVGLTLQVTVSAFAAYALARKRFRGASLVLLALLATMMMPEEVISIPLYLLIGRMRLLNTYPGLILPLSLPALGTCAVFGFLMIWDQYLLPLLVVQTPGMNTLTLVVTGLAASQEQGEGVRLAAAVVLMVPSILIYLGLQRLFERGLLSGSLKG